MSKIRMVCPHCGKRFRTGEEYLGKMARCPGCRQQITIIHIPKKESASDQESGAE